MDGGKKNTHTQKKNTVQSSYYAGVYGQQKYINNAKNQTTQKHAGNGEKKKRKTVNQTTKLQTKAE